MPPISLIAALDEAQGIGKDNQLLCHLPADLQHFKQLTLGKAVIMGRKTFDSIGKPLPGRLNVVLSTTVRTIDGVLVVDSLSKALDLTCNMPEQMIIGGASIYEQALPLATYMYLTVIHAHFDADVFFPAFDEDEWKCCEESYRPLDEKNPYALTFKTLKKDFKRFQKSG